MIALTIDEVGMAKTRERKLEIAKRIKELACDEHGLDPARCGEEICFEKVPAQYGTYPDWLCQWRSHQFTYRLEL